MFKSHQIAGTSLVQRAVRTLYPYGSAAAVRRGPLKGLKVIVGPSMGLSYIWHTSPREWEWLRSIAPDQCVYDIGANLGELCAEVGDGLKR